MLSESVGKDGSNLPDDVMAVQRLLGDLQIAAGDSPMGVDGNVSDDTVSAIIKFQDQFSDLPSDGLIEPDGDTFTRLDEVCANLYATIMQQQAAPVLEQSKPSDAPDDLAPRLKDILSDFSALAPDGSADGADQFESPIPDFKSQINAASAAGPLLGTVQVVPVVIIVLMIMTLLIVITSNPIWQRAAREMVQGLKDRSRLLSQKIRDAIQAAIDTIEEFLGASACAELCVDELNALKDLQQQIEDLLNRMPEMDNDPVAMKALQFRLARLYDQFLAAQQAVVDCMVRNGC